MGPGLDGEFFAPDFEQENVPEDWVPPNRSGRREKAALDDARAARLLRIHERNLAPTHVLAGMDRATRNRAKRLRKKRST